MAEETDVYISVKRGQTSNWKPVKAVRRRDDVYEIVGRNAASAQETWQFTTGDLVRCKPYELTDGDMVLVAWEKVAVAD